MSYYLGFEDGAYLPVGYINRQEIKQIALDDPTLYEI